MFSKILLYLAFSMTILTLCFLENVSCSKSNVYPRESKSRVVKLLDGIWDFRVSQANPGSEAEEKWYEQELKKSGPIIPMPVPSSYNDITMKKEVQNHLGTVWYETKFNVPNSWHLMNYRVWLRFGGVNYAAKVWINGEEAMNHEIGYLPFGADITKLIMYRKVNRLTVRVQSALSENTIPQSFSDESIKENEFNYAGIQRSVYLYSTPQTYIEDIYINADVLYGEDEGPGSLAYSIEVGGQPENSTVKYSIKLMNKEGKEVLTENHSTKDIEVISGLLKIPNATIWWPYLMHENPGYLYTLRIEIVQGLNTDVYDQPVGFRSVKLLREDNEITINGKPLYIRGVSGHEDAYICGPRLDIALSARDINLIKWLGVNTYRTSGRPVSEEMMEFADQNGIMVINEAPAINIRKTFSHELNEKHIDCIEELVNRDRSRPSVIMWSIGSDLNTPTQESIEYYNSILDDIGKFDPYREFTATIPASTIMDNQLVKAFNIIGVSGLGTESLQTSANQITSKIISYLENLKKNVFVADYGIDTTSGRTGPFGYVSEQYQVELISAHFKAFDILKERLNNLFIGEVTKLVCSDNPQEARRGKIDGRGVLTRQRQPLLTAQYLRRRYWLLGLEFDNTPLPPDLVNYVINAGFLKPAATTVNTIDQNTQTNDQAPPINESTPAQDIEQATETVQEKVEGEDITETKAIVDESKTQGVAEVTEKDTEVTVNEAEVTEKEAEVTEEEVEVIEKEAESINEAVEQSTDQDKEKPAEVKINLSNSTGEVSDPINGTTINDKKDHIVIDIK